MRTHRPALVLPLLVCAALVAGCAPASYDSLDIPESNSATASAAPVETTAPTTPTPVATADPVPVTDGVYDPDCDTILNASASAQLAADGLEERAYEPGEDAWSVLLQAMIDEGGIVCQWVKPDTDLRQTVAFAPADAAAADERKAAVQAAGWTESDGTGGLLFTSPDAGDPGLDRPFLFAEGYYFGASSSAVLADLALG